MIYLEFLFPLSKKAWGELTGTWVDLGRREEVMGFIDFWTARTGIPARNLCRWLGIRGSKLSVWRTRTGIPNAHAPFVPREDCLAGDEVKAMADFHREHPFDGHRRCAYMMMDADVAVASPPTAYPVLRRAGVMRPRRARRGCKGTGFRQPDAPHRRWHADITHVMVNGVPAYKCAFWDGRCYYAERLAGFEERRIIQVERERN